MLSSISYIFLPGFSCVCWKDLRICHARQLQEGNMETSAFHLDDSVLVQVEFLMSPRYLQIRRVCMLSALRNRTATVKQKKRRKRMSSAEQCNSFFCLQTLPLGKGKTGQLCRNGSLCVRARDGTTLLEAAIITAETADWEGAE